MDGRVQSKRRKKKTKKRGKQNDKAGVLVKITWTTGVNVSSARLPPRH